VATSAKGVRVQERTDGVHQRGTRGLNSMGDREMQCREEGLEFTMERRGSSGMEYGERLVILGDDPRLRWRIFAIRLLDNPRPARRR